MNIIEEIWIDCTDNTDYQVSNLGRVYSKTREVNNNGKKYIKEGRILSPCKNKYFKVTFYKDNIQHKRCVHTLIAKAFIPNPENKPCVNHIDGNKYNNNINNLEWVTYKENTQHAIVTGLSTSKGENNGMAKLTDAQLVEIRSKYTGVKGNQVELAKEYKINRSTICKIVNNKVRITTNQ